MKDIAGRAGVSRPTVSAILNDRRSVGISSETRRRVLEVAESLGYRRNELARAVVTGKSRMIGYLAGDPHREHIARTMVGAVDALDAHGYTLKLLRLQGEEHDVHAVHRCIELCLSGIIIVHPGDKRWLDYVHVEMERRSVPIAIVDSSLRYPWAIRVITDDEEGARLATSHLIGLGHRRIAFIGGTRQSPVSNLREAGYLSALSDAGLPSTAEDIKYGEWDPSLTHAVALSLLSRSDGERPTAIFCASDNMALVVLRTARELGFTAPRDLSVVGYGCLELTDLADPALTSVAQPFEEVGQAAVNLLVEQIEKPSGDRDMLMPEQIVSTHLVVRQSTASPPSTSDTVGR